MRQFIDRILRLLASPRLRILGDRRGSVFIIMGFALIPLTFSVGMGIDYARAARMQTRLNALADSAALSTVTNTMMQQSQFNAAVTSYYMWYQQANGTSGMLVPYATGCCAYSQSAPSPTSTTVRSTSRSPIRRPPATAGPRRCRGMRHRRIRSARCSTCRRSN